MGNSYLIIKHLDEDAKSIRELSSTVKKSYMWTFNMCKILESKDILKIINEKHKSSISLTKKGKQYKKHIDKIEEVLEI
jgi:predicted transcriptional regulator